MLNDRKTSELLSKSFHGILTDHEQIELNQSVAESKESDSFARITRLIQDSVTDIAAASQAGDPSVAAGLSADAKLRLRNSVREAKRMTLGGTVEVEPPSSSRATNTGVPGDSRKTAARFTLLRKIGEGGLGAVWLARDEILKRTVAIKEMHAGKGDSPKHLLRFQREATITGFLEHPNVVPLYLFGEHADTGKPFYAMRFLGKQTLADRIGEYHARREAGHAESIDLHRLLTAFLDVCQAIAYAHSRGVVHRDLKPENVALDNFGQVIVLDWGIAKLLSDGELAIQSSLNPCTADDCSLTNTMEGEVVGTPMYMAPEQAAGDLDSVDQRTDVYGLGAILFAILTGRAPHETTIKDFDYSRIKDLLSAISEQDAILPRELNPSVPRDLEAICVRAMSNQRYSRHATAVELAEDVEHWMAGQQEKQQQYDAMRLEGHDLRSSLTSRIRDFCTNVRFMSTLPPIEGLIDSSNGQDQEGESVWRDRLATIFRGLLRSNSDFTAVSYTRVFDGQSQELVRVERPSVDVEVRTVPKSRLASGPLSQFAQAVMQKKPDDVHVAVGPVAVESATMMCSAPLRLEAAVPVFDREEEPYGLVAIEGDFDRLFGASLQDRSRVSGRALVIDQDEKVLLEDSDSARSSVGKSVMEAVANWNEIKQELGMTCDYLDPSREVFATRVALVPRTSAVTLLLIARS